MGRISRLNSLAGSIVLLFLVAACAGARGTAVAAATATPALKNQAAPPLPFPLPIPFWLPGVTPQPTPQPTEAVILPQTGGVNPCALVKRPEADAAAGVHFDAPSQRSVSLDGLKGATCSYGISGETTRVLVALADFPNAAAAGVTFNQAEQAARAGRADFSEVPGMGERAFTSPWSVSVLDGSRVISIEVIRRIEDTDPAPAVSLAHSALARLNHAG